MEAKPMVGALPQPALSLRSLAFKMCGLVELKDRDARPGGPGWTLVFCCNTDKECSFSHCITFSYSAFLIGAQRHSNPPVKPAAWACLYG